jgi:shikimate 5-dehydrogenase
MIVKVPKQDVDFVWKDCKPFLEKALDDTYSLEDIYKGIQKDFFQLWISWQGGVECAVITEMAEYPQKKNITILSRRRKKSRSLVDRHTNENRRFCKTQWL